jgi:hypothetical protein
MKYSISIDLDLPRARVIELFDCTENLYKWQRGLQSFEALDGDPGQPGARSKMVFQMGKRKIEMVETITKRDLPDAFDGTYDGQGVHNVVKNRFVELGPDKTRWESDQEFQFKGFMKLIGFFMPGAFKKQSLKYAQDFKAFAEDGVDVRNTD